MRSFFIYNDVQNASGLKKTLFLTKMVLYQQYRYIFKGILSDDIEDNDIQKHPSVGFSQCTGRASTHVTMDGSEL